VCQTLGDAKAAVANDGFTVGFVAPDGVPDGWFVQAQAPQAEAQRPPGTEINFVVVEQKPDSCQ
jgi:hypothetical protein